MAERFDTRSPLFVDKNVVVLLVLTLVASGVHFIDNAIRLDLYRSPAWFTPLGVLLAWLCVPALAWLAFRTQSIVVLLLFSTFGLLGLEHYLVAPMCGFSWRSNATILAEAGVSVVMLTYITAKLVSSRV